MDNWNGPYHKEPRSPRSQIIPPYPQLVNRNIRNCQRVQYSDVSGDGAQPDDPLNQQMSRANLQDADQNEEESDEDPFGDAVMSFAEHRRDVANAGIQGEGRRGAARGRGRGRGRGPGRGHEQSPDDESSDEPPRRRGRPPGEGSRGGRKGRRGPRGAAEPTQEFKILQNQASSAFLSQNYVDALQYAQKAIQVNPEIYAAHGLLSAVYAAIGEEEKSFGALWNGAHTKRDPGLWWQIIYKLETMGGNNRRAHLERLSYCYSQILHLDTSDFEARRGQLAIATELGHPGKAIRQCQYMLKLRPYDNQTIEELAKQNLAYDRPDKAIEAYEDAIGHHMQTGNVGDNAFTFSDLNVYLGIYEETKQYVQGIHKLRSIARWLLGRREERYWDRYEDDDREWDVEDEPRRIQVDEYFAEKYDPDTYGSGLPLELRVKLGIFRLKARLDYLPEAMRHFSHLEPEDESPGAKIYDYYDLFRDVADALKGRGYIKDALTFYEPLQRLTEEPDFSLLTALADCYHVLGRLQEAEMCLRSALDAAADDSIADVGKQLTSTSEQIAAGVTLVKIYDAQGLSKQALDQANQVLRISRSEPMPVDMQQSSSPADTPAQSTIFSVPAPKKAGKQKLKQIVKGAEAEKSAVGPRRRRDMRRETARLRSEVDIRPQTRADIMVLHSQLTNSRDSMRAGDEEATVQWMEAAEAMIYAFRAERLFYPFDKYVRFWGYSKEAKAKGVNMKGNDALAEVEAIRAREAQGHDQDSIPDDYRGIKFTEWLDIFCEYAFMLAKRDNLAYCYETLTAASDANVFYHYDAHMLHIHVTWIACALLLADEERLLYLARYFIKRHPATPSTYSLYAALARLYTGPVTWYHSGPSQKFVLRQIKATDYAVLTPSQRGHYDFTATEISNFHKGSADGNPHGLQDIDLTVLVLYGNILARSGSYPHALNYYFRAYAVNPDNVMVNLCIAVTYIQFAMKRQAENRQYQIAQGLAFLERYCELRTRGGGKVHLLEAEFNRARAWHALGLAHLAMDGYERVLELAERMGREGRTEGEGQGRVGYEADAAYCLQQLYALGGDVVRAREVTEKWMVL